jgi:hypothetical protein
MTITDAVGAGTAAEEAEDQAEAVVAEATTKLTTGF